tara:strand:- start:500 stop:808 length:309 start_codon:yes stop_codon:yes gene_type:complete
MKEFSIALSKSDVLILAPTYAAGEAVIKDATSASMAKFILSFKPDLELYIGKTLDEVVNLIKQKSNANDLILGMGAGDINTLWQLLNKEEEIRSCLTNKKAA